MCVPLANDIYLTKLIFNKKNRRKKNLILINLFNSITNNIIGKKKLIS